MKTASLMPETERNRVRDEFRRLIRGTLRGSDVMMECGESQVFLLLPGIRDNDIDRVLNRLLREWKQAGYSDIAEVDMEYAEVEAGRRTYRRE